MSIRLWPSPLRPSPLRPSPWPNPSIEKAALAGAPGCASSELHILFAVVQSGSIAKAAICASLGPPCRSDDETPRTILQIVKGADACMNATIAGKPRYRAGARQSPANAINRPRPDRNARWSSGRRGLWRSTAGCSRAAGPRRRQSSRSCRTATTPHNVSALARRRPWPADTR